MCAALLQSATNMLSKQIHYDFQMRNLKSVLLIAAQLRSHQPGVLSTDQEASLVRVALLRCNLSKLKQQDAPVSAAC